MSKIMPTVRIIGRYRRFLKSVRQAFSDLVGSSGLWLDLDRDTFVLLAKCGWIDYTTEGPILSKKAVAEICSFNGKKIKNGTKHK